MKQNPIILINFDTAFQDGGKILPLKRKVKKLLRTLSKNFRIIIYSKKYFHEALQWIVKNNLHENCIARLTRRKSRNSFYIDKL